jgi:hypothetical protein
LRYRDAICPKKKSPLFSDGLSHTELLPVTAGCDFTGFRQDTIIALGSIPMSLLSLNESGWMTQKPFYFWCHIFVSELSLYRPSVPPNIQSQWFLLLLDGHFSVAILESLQFLQQNQVDVLYISSHCTRVQQPLNVELPLRSRQGAKRDFNLGEWIFRMLISDLRLCSILNPKTKGHSTSKDELVSTVLYQHGKMLSAATLFARDFPKLGLFR